MEGTKRWRVNAAADGDGNALTTELAPIEETVDDVDDDTEAADGNICKRSKTGRKTVP